MNLAEILWHRSASQASIPLRHCLEKPTLFSAFHHLLDLSYESRVREHRCLRLESHTLVYPFVIKHTCAPLRFLNHLVAVRDLEFKLPKPISLLNVVLVYLYYALPLATAASGQSSQLIGLIVAPDFDVLIFIDIACFDLEQF